MKIISHINKIKMMGKMELTCEIQIKRNFSATKITSQYKIVLLNPLKRIFIVIHLDLRKN